ncbi:hypothetical protein OAK06_01735 [Gammaproteobacteria bacterium]|nr:hypothetical protein [Gammaproteobacteria bacterium]
MKYLLIFSISIASHLCFASYHTDGEDGSDSGGSGGGYGGGSSAAALVGVGVLAYFLLRDNGDEEASESDLKFNFSNQESKLKIDFNKNELNSFNENNSSFEYPATKFQINLRYKLN